MKFSPLYWWHAWRLAVWRSDQRSARYGIEVLEWLGRREEAWLMTTRLHIRESKATVLANYHKWMMDKLCGGPWHDLPTYKE